MPNKGGGGRREAGDGKKMGAPSNAEKLAREPKAEGRRVSGRVCTVSLAYSERCSVSRGKRVFGT